MPKLYYILQYFIKVYKWFLTESHKGWCHQMKTFSALLVLCAGKSPVTAEFSSKRPLAWSFDVFFDLHLNKRLSKQSGGWWFETPYCCLWRHCNASEHLSVHNEHQLNSLKPSDLIWRNSSGSILAQVMACCLTAPSHYLNQSWLIISKV